MEGLVQLAAAVALLALAALAIRAYLFVKRLHRLTDQISRLVESDVAPSIRALGDIAQGARQAVGKLDDGLGSLANSLQRIDRLTEKLEPEAMTRTMLHPAVAKIVSWLTGVRKGIASVRAHRRGHAGASDAEEAEAG